MRFIRWLRWRWFCWRNAICPIHRVPTAQGDVRCSWTECKICTAEAEEQAESEIQRKLEGFQMINLGDRVRDRITGFTGIAVARAEYLYGCNRFSVLPEKLADKKIQESQWFDEPQLDLVKAKIIIGNQDTGGPQPAPRRNPDPSR